MSQKRIATTNMIRRVKQLIDEQNKPVTNYFVFTRLNIHRMVSLDALRLLTDYDLVGIVKRGALVSYFSKIRQTSSNIKKKLKKEELKDKESIVSGKCPDCGSNIILRQK